MRRDQGAQHDSARRGSLLVIDIHSHVVPLVDPPETAGGWPRVDVTGDCGDVYMGDLRFRTVRRESWDLARRVDEISSLGIEVQVLSPMPELFCYWADTGAARSYCRSVNDWLADAVAGGDGRFEGFGIVPLQDPDAAAAMLSEIADAGLRGIEIGTNINGVPLHDPRFTIVFEECARRGLVTFVHAFHPPSFGRFTPAVGNAITFPNDVGETLAGLLAGGLLENVPGLRLCGSHAGGSLSVVLPRLDLMWAIDEEFRDSLARAPGVYARQLWVDCLAYSPAVLTLVMRMLGPAATVFGSDYPFLPMPGADALCGEGTAPTIEELESALDGNARRLLP